MAKDTYGDVEINGQPYRNYLTTYRDKDLADFAPRAATPGGSVIHSELLLYQPLMQTDWRHGFGHVWYDDAEGYQTTEGNVDTRHKGIAMLYTKPTISDAATWSKEGFVSFGGDLYAWGSSGVRRYSGGSWATVYTGDVNFMLATNTYLFIFPDGDRVIRSTSGDANESGKAYLITNLAGANNDIIFQAKTGGTGGNDLTIEYKTTGVTAQTGDALAIKINSGVTLASAVITEVNAFTAAKVTATLRSGNDGTGTVSTMAATNLANGSASGAKAVYTTQQGVANSELKFTAVSEGTAGNSITITYATGAAAAGSEVVAVSGTDVTVTLHADSTAQQVMNAVLADVPQTASARTALEDGDNDILYTAVAAGNAGELIQIIYTYTGAITGPGAETVAVSGSVITVNIHPNTKAAHVIDAVNNDGSASALVTAAVAPGDSGNGTLLPTGSATTWTTTTQLSNGAASSILNLLTVNRASGSDGTGKPGAMTSKTLQGGSGNNSWQDAGRNENAEDMLWAEFHAGKVYVGEDSSNRVHHASQLELDDLEGGNTDSNKIEVGNTDSTITGIVYAEGLYLAKQDGMWKYDDELGYARRILDYANEKSSTNFRSVAVYNGYLIFPIRDALYQWNAARLADITPDRLNDQFPFTTYGLFDNFVVVDGFFYCTARTNETSYTESLLCYDGVSWFRLSDPVTDGDGSITAMGYDVDNNYLWYHHQTGSAVENTYYIPFQDYSTYPYADFYTTRTHALITSRLDVGFRHVTKSCPSLLVEASNLSEANQEIHVYYRTDWNTTWIKWGEVFKDGVTELTLPNNLRTVESKYIQFRFVFVTNDSAQSPILESWTMRFLMRPDDFYGYNFNVIVSDNSLQDMEVSDDRSAEEIVQGLREARRSKSPIRFVDIDGVTRYGYISAMSRQVIERHVANEMGMDPTLESVMNVNFVELRLDDGTT